MGSTRLDHQIFACLCPGIESDRDTMALHEILLGTVFGVCFFLLFIRGDRTNSYPCWYRIYNRLSVSIEYAKAYVHLLSILLTGYSDTFFSAIALDCRPTPGLSCYWKRERSGRCKQSAPGPCSARTAT